MEVSARKQYGLPMDLKQVKGRSMFLPNLASVLKSRDVTLLTRVCLVKAMVFPVVMYRCANWTIRRLSTEELMLLNCDAGEDF